MNLVFLYSDVRYRAFDELDGIEVAWNQVKVHDVLHNSGDIERLYSELHLLKTLKHKNIIKFYSSWVDTRSRNVNFITEIFTSGNLRQYRKKHKHVKLRAVKNWSRQILRGLVFLHSRDPPIIHRDLKCDNIFINGNNGEVKIGDLGLATILRRSPAAQSVIGTPEFMAPELYEEHYNELVDVYSFGMCLLEMLTSEYPYSECTNAAQIYKKVTTGKKPAALVKIKDPQIREFVEKCITSASQRLQARELLMDPFLSDDMDADMIETSVSGHGTIWGLHPIPENAYLRPEEVPANGHSGNGGSLQHENRSSGKQLSSEVANVKEGIRSSKDFRIKGRKQDDKKVLVRIRIASPGGEVRVIQFDFDVDADTAMSVASEMVTELDLSDQDVTTIAEMIDEEIMALIPDWKPGLAFDEADNDIGTEQNGHAVDLPFTPGGGESDLMVDTADTIIIDRSDDSLQASGQTYGRFEEVECTASNTDQQQHESYGLGYFSDFSSEHLESSGSDSSSGAQSKSEVGVDNESMPQSLKGCETIGGKDFSQSLDEENLKRDHLMSTFSECKLDDSEILRLVTQQHEELQTLKLKHREALSVLKTRLVQGASAVREKSAEMFLHGLGKQGLEMTHSSELQKDSKSELVIRTMEGSSDVATTSKMAPLMFGSSEGMLFAVLDQDGISPQASTHNSSITNARQETGTIEMSSVRVIDSSSNLHCEQLAFMATKSEILKSTDNTLVGIGEGYSDCVSSKNTEVPGTLVGVLAPEARSVLESHEDPKPDTSAIVRRESYLEFYKAASSKEKFPCSKSSESLFSLDRPPVAKDAKQEQLKKIAEFADKNIENLLQSKNKYIVTPLKNVTLQGGTQNAAGKIHSQAGQQVGAAKTVPSAMLQNGQQITANRLVQNCQPTCVTKNPGSVIQSANVKIPGDGPHNTQQGASLKSSAQPCQHVITGKNIYGIGTQNTQQDGSVKNVTSAPVQVIQQSASGKKNLSSTLLNGAAANV
ncbi:hypothetical protein KP509_11G077000 [Ceratopteris richardii]|uniref:non-specific serine/threonine protein kinase n=1 Tax=Ceratopteris richardii TaxID=49495 RepID=A0A8T2TW85_CERRI|nr:hypothetical protein KP509_11G077000 [Ceratopteris richardii]